MLLDSTGNIAWSHELPEELIRKYSLADTAVFSKWYHEDYPVTVWEHGEGLLVVGQPKDSAIKYNLSFTYGVFDSLLWFGVILIVCALLIVALITYVTGYRQYQSIRKIEEGLSSLAGDGSVQLTLKGPMKGLQNKLNIVSDTLEKQRKLIDDRDSARTNWISGISHDVRTPLTLILGYADELTISEGLSDEDKEKAQSIHRQCLRIRKLVEDLNLASKLEYEMQPLKEAEVHIDALIREVASDTLNDGLPSIYELDISLPEDAPHMVVMGDHNLLKRALQNVIDNSIRHNPNGCTIRLELSCRGNECTIEIKDNGTGVNEARLAQLRRLTQESLSDSDAVAEQHGLGLRIASQIVFAHKGKLQINSLEGEGFSVRMNLGMVAE